MHAFAANLLQVGMLGLGVSLMLLWIDHLKTDRAPATVEESEDRSEEVAVAAATRGRTGP